MNFFIDQQKADARAVFAAGEAFRQTGHALSNGGAELRLEKMSEGLSVSVRNGAYKIGYSSLSSLMRAVGILCGHLNDDSFQTEQKPQRETLCAMLDCSRNAVLNRERRKEFCRLLAVMGYNAVMLYTEDTYRIEGQPYFGHQRATLTTEDFQELDDYCDSIGMELIPCIQTLAHLNTFFGWPAAGKYCDCKDILLVDDEKVYALIDSMIATMRKNVRSRRIHIGMDEAGMLGRGSYLSKNGYHPPKELMKRHLARVMEICRKYDFKPMIWSDMFFLMGPNTTHYYDKNTHITEDIAGIVPPDLSLVYWDYDGVDLAKYEHMFAEHCKFHNEIVWAGGAQTWSGLVPLNRYSVNSERAALSVAKKYPVRFVIVTMWGDDGGMCSPFSAIPTLQLFAESQWGCATDDDALRARMRECADADYDAFMDMEEINNIPGRQKFGYTAELPTRYMFYQDILLGMFDKHVSKGSNAHFAECAERFERYCHGKWEYIFRPMQALCRVLSQKAELGLFLKEAYDRGDREELKRLADGIPQIVCEIERLHEVFREQWMRDNCRIGFEVQDIRFGALTFRLKQAQRVLLDYAEGKIDRIEELEADRLYYRPPHEGDEEKLICVPLRYWAKMLTANLFTKSLYY